MVFTNQNGEDTNQIGRFEVLDVILHRHNGQAGGWTAKWMLAFTKLACMIWGFSLLSQRIIIRTFLIYIGAHQASQVAKL